MMHASTGGSNAPPMPWHESGLSFQQINQRDRLMAARLLSLTGRILPVALLLLVALVSMPAESATKKATPKGTGNPFDQLKGY